MPYPIWKVTHRVGKNEDETNTSFFLDFTNSIQCIRSSFPNFFFSSYHSSKYSNHFVMCISIECTHAHWNKKKNTKSTNVRAITTTTKKTIFCRSLLLDVSRIYKNWLRVKNEPELSAQLWTHMHFWKRSHWKVFEMW